MANLTARSSRAATRSAEVVRVWNEPPYLSLARIGQKFGISRQRVQQMLLVAARSGMAMLTAAERAELRGNWRGVRRQPNGTTTQSRAMGTTQPPGWPQEQLPDGVVMIPKDLAAAAMKHLIFMVKTHDMLKSQGRVAKFTLPEDTVGDLRALIIAVAKHGSTAR